MYVNSREYNRYGILSLLTWKLEPAPAYSFDYWECWKEKNQNVYKCDWHLYALCEESTGVDIHPF